MARTGPSYLPDELVNSLAAKIVKSGARGKPAGWLRSRNHTVHDREVTTVALVCTLAKRRSHESWLNTPQRLVRSAHLSRSSVSALDRSHTTMWRASPIRSQRLRIVNV